MKTNQSSGFKASLQNLNNKLNKILFISIKNRL